MKKQILLVIFVGCCLVASHAQSEPEKRNLSEISGKVSKTTITFRYLDDEPIIVDSNDNIIKSVQILKQNPKLKLVVEGYANDYTSAQDNSDLAQRRANKVREIFIQKGVFQDQIEVVAYSVSAPHASPDSDEHRLAAFKIVVKD